jgi:hypothetical protein
MNNKLYATISVQFVVASLSTSLDGSLTLTAVPVLYFESSSGASVH